MTIYLSIYLSLVIGLSVLWYNRKQFISGASTAALIYMPRLFLSRKIISESEVIGTKKALQEARDQKTINIDEVHFFFVMSGLMLLCLLGYIFIAVYRVYEPGSSIFFDKELYKFNFQTEGIGRFILICITQLFSGMTIGIIIFWLLSIYSYLKKMTVITAEVMSNPETKDVEKYRAINKQKLTKATPQIGQLIDNYKKSFNWQVNFLLVVAIISFFLNLIIY